MCGIGGWIGRQNGGEEVADRMRKALHHRGPDSYGIRSLPEATLVHTRLSIIDLSKSGSQPMANESGTVWSIFNGEIYNHRDLRSYLEQRGHHFKGHSDSEVIPHLYEELGIGFVERLRGMFAIAIYDANTRTLILARDRFGIKPLFYAPTKTRLAFASELQAILKVPGIDTRPDRQAVRDYAALFCIPAPETFYRGVRALQAGEVLEASLDASAVAWRTKQYWKGCIAPDQSISLSEAVDRAEELITAAVRRQLESEVPLGALLSGGIDSSLVSTAAQESLQGKLRTFNVRFPDPRYDETWAALAVAEHIKSQHVTLDMGNSQGTWEHITGLLRHAGQPFADTSLFAVNAVSRLVRAHVTVALSGDGGDEAFGGYNLYWQIASIARFQMLPALLRRTAPIAMTPLARFGIIPESYRDRYKDFVDGDDISIIQNLFCWVREEEQGRLCLDFDQTLPIRRLFEPRWEHRVPPGLSRAERLSVLATESNIRLILPNDFLFKVDMASMKESLEVRVPMLDEDLFALGLSLPHSCKVKGRTCKKVLRGVGNRWLPTAVAEKPKLGFVIPFDTWVDSNFKAMLKESLLGPSSRLPEFFNPAAYKPILEAFCEDRPCVGISRGGLYGRAIMLLSVQVATELLA
jgi:asparagine synthase (glutamine-hydrolysing)